MKIFKGFLVAFSLLYGTVGAQVAFDDDPVNFYVSDNGTNNALRQVNLLICYVNAMAPDQMVNRGPYVANIYEDECDEDDTSTSDQASATATSAQSASNSGDSASSSSATSAREEREVTSSIIEVTRANNNAPMIAKVWVDVPAQQDEFFSSPEMLIYVKATITTQPSATARFGDFVMSMTYTLASDFSPGGGMPTIPAGATIGGGYLATTANSVVFKDAQMSSAPKGLSATFTGTNKISGVYNQGSWVGEQDGFSIQLVQQFALDDAIKLYCTEYISSYIVDMENPDEDGRPTLVAYTPTGNDGLTTDEACYSLALADAQRTVHRYGVYNTDGSRLSLGQGGFPLTAEVTDTSGDTVKVHAFGDYYGVYYSSRFNDLIKTTADAAPTIFTKEKFLTDTGPDQTYTIAQANAKLQKITKSFLALSELDGVNASMYVDGADSFWGTQFVSLGFPAENSEYQGTYSHATETWTFDKKISFGYGYSETDITPITFTNAVWVSTMTKTFENNPNTTDDDHTEVRGLWIYSPDSGQGYDIRKNALLNPTDGTSTNGIAVNTSQTLMPNEFPAELKCIEQCPTAALINASIQAAINSETGAAISSPYAVDNWPILKGTNNAEDTGRNFPGILGTNVQTYTASGLKILDGTSTEMAVSTSITDPSTQLNSAIFYWPWGDGASFSQQIGRGFGTGKLLLPDDLSKIECEKNADGTYRDTHPEFEASAIRYCSNILYDPSSTIMTWYEIRFGANNWDRQKYLIDQSTTLYVDFDPPKRLYYDVPNETKYGEDAGKTITLQYNGFGDLQGIPGEVIDTRTGESIGKYVDYWMPWYRYVQRFVIEENASGEAPLLKEGGSSTTTYKIKALQGEEWLLRKNDLVGTLTLSGTETDLPDKSVIIDVSPNGNAENQIGTEPSTSSLLNEGNPSVIHGAVVITLD